MAKASGSKSSNDRHVASDLIQQAWQAHQNPQTPQTNYRVGSSGASQGSGSSQGWNPLVDQAPAKTEQQKAQEGRAAAEKKAQQQQQEQRETKFSDEANEAKTEKDQHTDNYHHYLNEADRLAVEKTSREGLTVKEQNEYDRQIKEAKAKAEEERQAAGIKNTKEKWEDLRNTKDDFESPDAWAFLQPDEQTENLAGGWGRQYAAGPTMAAGTGLQWFDAASDDMVRYEYDQEHGEGAYDKAIAGKNVNQIGQLGDKLWDTGVGLQESGQQMWEAGTADMSDTGKQIANVAKTGMDVVGDIALNAAMPGMGTMRMYTGAAGNSAYEQSQRENNDVDSRMIAAMKGGLSAYLSTRLVGGVETYGESVLGKYVHSGLEGLSPEVQQVLKPFLNTEGIEEGLENILNYAADEILGLDTGKPLNWNDVAQDAAVGYILGVLTNGLAGGMNIDSKHQQNIGKEAVEYGAKVANGEISGIDEAAEIGKQNTRDQVVLKATPEAETETTAEPERDITPGAEMPTAETPTQHNNGNGPWEGWKGWVQETLSGGALSDTDIDAIYRRDAARQAFEELTGVSLEGMTEEEAKATIGMAAGTMKSGVNPGAGQAAESAQETTANNETPGTGTNPEENDTAGANPNQESQQTAENQQQNEGNPNTEETAEPNPNQKQDQKKKTDHTKKVEGPDENTNEAFDKLNEEHGSIEPGENPARDINVPKKDTKGNKVGEGARTIFEADATPDERVASLKAAVVNGNFGHIPVTNDTRSKNAVSKLAKDGWAKSAADFLAAVESGKVDADTIALGAHLLNEAGNSTDCSGKQYVELCMAYNDAVSGTGQALAAGRILKTLTPEGKLYGIEKTIEKMNKDIRKNNEKRGPNRQKAEIKLNEGLVEEYLNAETDEERDAIHDDIIKDTAKQVPNTLRDKFIALRYLNMLGNFKTQVRNVLGNVGMGTVQKTKNMVASGIEGLASAATGGKYERKYKAFYGRDLHKAAVEDFKSDSTIKDAAMGEAKYSDVGKQAQSDIEKAKDPFNNKNPFGWMLNKYSKATTKAMEFGDEIFVQMTYADALAGYLNAHGIKAADWKAMVNDPAKAAEVDKARTYAIKQAQEATFRDTNALSKFVSTFDSRWGRLPKAITQGVIPFRKTPANVLVRMEEYSPLGLVNTGVKAAQAIKGNADASDVIDSLAKSLTGTGLAALGYMLKQRGRVRTKEDDKDRERLDKLEGKQDYSVEFDLPEQLGGGKRSFTLDWLTPASGSFFMGAELASIVEEGGISPSEAMSVLTSFTNPMLEMSMLSGVNDALNNLSDFDGDNSAVLQFALNSAWSYLTQGLSNTLLGQGEQFMEDYRQTYYTDKNNPLLTTSQQKKLAKLMNKTPLPKYGDYQAADYIDAWGRKQENDQNMGIRAVNVFFNPGYSSKMDKMATEADAVLEDLYKFGKEQTEQDSFPNVIPKTPSRYTTVNGTQLTPEEYDQYATTKGQESLKMVTEFSKSPEFKHMDKFAQAETIQDIYSYAEYLAAAETAKARGEKYYDNRYTGISKLDDPVGYIATHNTFSVATRGDTCDFKAIDSTITDIGKMSQKDQDYLRSKNSTLMNYYDYMTPNAFGYSVDSSRDVYTLKKAEKANAEARGVTQASGRDTFKAIQSGYVKRSFSESDVDALMSKQAKDGDFDVSKGRAAVYLAARADGEPVIKALQIAEYADVDNDGTIDEKGYYKKAENEGTKALKKAGVGKAGQKAFDEIMYPNGRWKNNHW